MSKNVPEGYKLVDDSHGGGKLVKDTFESNVHKIPESACLSCGNKVSAAGSLIDGMPQPSPGDITVCFRCGHIMAFADDLTMRELTMAEVVEVIADPAVMETTHMVKGNIWRTGKSRS